MARHASVIVPATSANLGPGFDAFGLAIGLFNRFEATDAPQWDVDVRGEGARYLRHDAGNRVAAAMAAGFEALGEAGRCARIVCENSIPTGRGLGSSAAAVIGGLTLAEQLVGTALGDERMLDLATELEGHPDNAAAALHGGFTIAWRTSDGSPRCTRIEPAGGVAVIAAIPPAELATAAARAMLPAEVGHEDAAHNAGRAGLLAIALATGRAELLRPGLADRIHERYRVSAIPDFDAVCDALTSAGADGVALSGAGPTVLGLVIDADDGVALARARRVAAVAQERLAGSSRGFAALGIARTGVRDSG